MADQRILADGVLRYELDDRYTILVNVITGAIDLLPTSFLDETPFAAAELAERGYFLSEAERMAHLERMRCLSREHAAHIPYWFYLLTTLRCNFGCPICYERNILASADMTVSAMERAVEFVGGFQCERQIPSERMRLILFGGEPLCVQDAAIVKTALVGAERAGWRVVIVTNGTRIQRFLPMFRTYASAISDFRVTLDGPRSVHDARRPYRGNGRGSFDDVVAAIGTLLESGFTVKVQTIIGRGNINAIDNLTGVFLERGWLARDNFQWRLEGSHDYANLDAGSDELTEGRMVERLIRLWVRYPVLHGKMKFESFKYLGHLVRSFGWLGTYKTYWGPKFGFCEPQKGFHYSIAPDGRIYHCPRTVNDPHFLVGATDSGFLPSERALKDRSILERDDCSVCALNALCGGGCAVQKANPSFDCRAYASAVISEFLQLMSADILRLADPNGIVSICDGWGAKPLR
jgi:uncharacterized protein